MTLRLCIYPLHVRPYGGAAFVGITHFENRKKGKGWSKNATLLTIAVQNVFMLRGNANILNFCFLKLL